MLPHLSRGSPAHQRGHQHYSTSCPLDCPARSAPHQAQHYPTQNNARLTHPHLDPSVLHPAFSGLFFQQRRTHATQTNIHCQPGSSAFVQPLAASPSPQPFLLHPVDPARVSPIFHGYSPNPDKPKM